MLITSLLLLACSGDVKDTGIEDTGVVEDTNDTDTEDTQDTSDTEDTSDTNDTDTEEPVETGTYRAQSMGQVVQQMVAGEPVGIPFRCLYENEGAVSVLQPDAFQLTVTPSSGTSVEMDMIMFTEAGDYNVTCGTEGTVVAANVQIAREVLNPNVQPTSFAMSEAEMALTDVVMANNGTDDDLIMGYNRLEMANDMLGQLDPPGVFRKIPAGFWPDADTLIANNMAPTADDGLFEAWCFDVRNTINQYNETFSSMSTSNPSAADLTTLDTLDATFQAQLAQLQGYQLSLAGWQSGQVAMTEILLLPLRDMLIQNLTWHMEQLESDSNGILPPFEIPAGSLELLQKSRTRVQVANQMHTEMVKGVNDLVVSFDSAGLINTTMPALDPVLLTHTSLSTEADTFTTGYVGGYVEGDGFASKGALNILYIADSLLFANIAKTALEDCAVENGSLMDQLESSEDCLFGVSGFADAVYGISVQSGGANGGNFTLNLDTLPACSTGSNGMVVWNMESGQVSDLTGITCAQ